MSHATGAERLGRRLYCSLSLLEISVYTSTWICGVLYSLYTLYLAGMEQVSTDYSLMINPSCVQISRGELRYAVEMERPWWRVWRSEKMYKDFADHEWITWKISVLQGNVSL